MRILLIEDDQAMARFLKGALEAEFFAVDIAKDREHGSFLARCNDYDLVMLGRSVLERRDLEICEEIRAHGKTMPILVTSVETSAFEKVWFLDAGVDDYLEKPYVIEELLARIRALTRRPRALGSDILHVEGIVLDTRHGTVTRHGKAIDLTRKEFMLLSYLMRNAGNVLSRGMILEHVWDMNVNIFSNTIESHILSLRKKLGDTQKGDRLIKTLTGRGYRLGI